MGHPARKSSTPWLIGDTAVGWKSSHQVCSVPRSPVALATGSSHRRNHQPPNKKIPNYFLDFKYSVRNHFQHDAYWFCCCSSNNSRRIKCLVS